MRPTATERRAFWLFALLAIIVLGAGLGLRDPWPADEPRFALSAKQMVDSGNWLIPHRGSELYSDKPPLFMAAQALSFELTGNWRVAFLLPSLLAAFGTLLLVYDLARRLWDRRTGLYAAGALLATFQFVYQAKRAQIDPTVTFFLTLANYGLLRHFVLGPDWRAYWLGCFAAGLGVITKGVGVLALLMFAPYIFARLQHWQNVDHARGGWAWAAGALAFSAAVSLWLVPMLLAVRHAASPDYAAYAHDILFHQTAGRYTDSWDHQHPFWYYAGVIATSWLPLTLALPWLLPRWRERLHARDARLLIPLTWIVLVVVFFSFPKGKRDVYVMPALPLLALCAAPFLREIVQRAGFRRVALGLIALLGAGFLAAGMYALAWNPPFAKQLAQERGLANGADMLWLLLIVLGLWTLACALIFGVRRGLHALLAGVAGMWLLWSLWAYPLLNDSSSAGGVMRHAAQVVGPDAQLGLVAWKEQDLLMADRAAVDFGFVRSWYLQLSDAIRWQEAAPETRWIFILGDAMAPCIDKSKATYAGHANRREWWLFRSDAVAAECRGGKVPANASQENPNAE